MLHNVEQKRDINYLLVSRSELDYMPLEIAIFARFI